MSVKWGWVSLQLSGVEASKPVEETTVALLRLLDEEAEKRLMTDDEIRTTLQYLAKLQAGHALVADKPDERWAGIRPGEYQIRDIVRVQSDAYDGEYGKRHNGKRGRIARVHQSKVVVIYDDASSPDESFYHDPAKLERLL